MSTGENPSLSLDTRLVKTPYTLPGDGQLLAYWQYRSNATGRPEDAEIGIVDFKSSASDRGEGKAKKRLDANEDLMKELRKFGGSTGFSGSHYVRDIRLLSKWRLLVGQKRDACIQIDQQIDIERQKYLEMKREYKECVTAMENFLAKDHEESMGAMGAAEAELKRTTELSDLRDDLSRRYGQTRLEVYHWEEAWRTVKACHAFLKRVSPLEDDDEDEKQRVPPAADQPIQNRSADGEGEELEAANKRDSNEIAQASSLESIIAGFEKEAIELASKSSAKTAADLGFLEPADLLTVFRNTEQQNLNALIHSESLGGPMADMIARIDVAEVRVKREIDDVLEDIKQLEVAIEREEHRAELLESQSARLVQRRFRALVCSPEALQARILVEEAYENCVAPNEAGLDALAMARGLEAIYEKLSAELDALPRHLVVACEKEGFQQEMKESREAEEASKKFELMQRLLAGLRRLMEPTPPRRRVLVRRSPVSRIRRTRRRRSKKGNENVEGSSKARENPTEDFFGKHCKPKKMSGESKEDQAEK